MCSKVFSKDFIYCKFLLGAELETDIKIGLSILAKVLQIIILLLFRDKFDLEA